MNTSHLSAILLFCFGLLAMPHAAFKIVVAKAPACIQDPLSGDQSGATNQESTQPAEPSILDPDPTSKFMSPSRELVRPLVRAIRLSKEGDDNDAAELIGAFLADSGGEDFLVLSDRTKGTAISISRVATDMLGSLPKSAINSYRVRFGVPARQRLSLAIAESNYSEISQVMQRYPFTDAGIEAAMLMGHHHFDAGRALLAAESFQTALELDISDRKSNPQLSVLAAVSWVLARRPELAEAVMKDLAKTGGGKFRLGDQEVLIDVEDPLAAIETFVGSGPMSSSTKVDQWLLVGGNARRSVTTADGFPVGQPIWQVDVSGRDAQREIEGARESIVSSMALSSTNVGSLVPANVPLIVDGLVLVGNEKQVSAVDFKSGKRAWAVASGVDVGAVVKKSQLNVPQRMNFMGRSEIRSTKPIDRDPWTDFLQGHASSDGKFIFHVVKSLSTLNSDNQLTNTLQAIDVLKEGELAWEVGGGLTTGDPRLAQVSFLGAPLPIDGILYGIGKHLQEIVLVALNSKDGKLVWMQSLASSEEVLRRYGRPLKTNIGHSLTPSYSKGILVCPTGKNALVAVDTIGRRVLWGAQTTGAESSPTKRSSKSLKTLQNPQVFVENSRVVAFDVSDQPRILAVSLLDGSPLMNIGKAGVRVEDVLHVASVDESRVVLVEKTRVRAISSDSGRKLWLTSIRKFGPPTGRGYVSENSLYLPTEGNAIIKIDLESGKIVDGIKTDHPFGNLILHQGRVISRRETSVACFELDSKVIAELNTAAEAVGGIEQVTPALKVKKAALLRHQGEARKAIKLLQTIDEDDRTGRFQSEFLQNATLMFESDPEYALTLFKDYENKFQFDTNPNSFLGYVELLVKYGMKEDVIKQLFAGDSFFTRIEPESDAGMMLRPINGYNLDTLNEAGEEENENAQPAEKTKSSKKAGKDDSGDDDSNKVNQTDKSSSSFLKNQAEFNKSRILFDKNHWAKAQLIRLANKSPDSIPQIQAAIEQRIASASVSGALERHRFLRQFPLEFVAPQMRFELAEKLIAKNHVAEAENVLASLLGFLPTTAEQIESTEISVDDLTKDSLVNLWSKIRDAQYGTPLKIADSEKTKPSVKLDFDRVDLKTTQAPKERVYPIVVQPRGEVANRYFSGKHVTIWGSAQELEVFGPTGESETRFQLFKEGKDRRVNLSVGSGWIQTNHSLAILRHRSMLLALDLSKLHLGQAAVIWKKTVLPTLSWRREIVDEFEVAVDPSLPPEDVTASFPTTGCCCFIDKDQLTCIDAFTGATLWTRTKDENHGNVFASGSQVVTMDAKLNECSVFDLRTGERLRKQAVSSLVQMLWQASGLSFTAVGKVDQPTLDELTEYEDFRLEKEAGDGDDGKDEQDKGADDEKEEGKGKKGKKQVVRKKSNSIRFLSRYDITAGELVWKKVFDGDAKICRLLDDRFAVLTGDNQLYIFDSLTGKELAKNAQWLVRRPT